MKMNVSALLECEVTNAELAHALFRQAYNMLTDDGKDEIDDAGCDWYTDDTGGIYIAFSDTVRIARNKKAAILIEAHNILKGYDLNVFRISPEQAKDIPDIYA